jgi:hypothetical protein
MAEIKFVDLTVDNLFDFCTVLDAVGAESVIAAFDQKEIAALQKSGKDTKNVGVAVAMKITGIIIKNLPKAKDEICSFFAKCMVWDNGTAVTLGEVKKFKIGQFAKIIRDFFKKEDLTDFFKEVAEYVGMEQSDLKN